ncbi:hypothetical protein LINPERPRIM_LOCUS18903 [Linum perenne]
MVEALHIHLLIVLSTTYCVADLWVFVKRLWSL